jgi:hypothetical protein
VQALRTTTRILTVIALTLLVAGCDKCGNWFGYAAPYSLEACKSTVPSKQ